MSAVTIVAAMKTFLVISDKHNAALIHSAGKVMHRNGSQNSILHARLTMEIQTSEEVMVEVKKGKAIPLQTWTGPEGSRRLRLPDFKTICT